MCAAWATHFESLGTSKLPESAPLQDLQSRLTYYQSTSLQNEDSVLESEIDIMEIDTEIGKLKQGKSPGPDGILPEHIIHSGPIFKLWLKKIFNYIISLEVVPQSFSNTTIVPIYKGKGRDPMQTSNYRGISLTSVIGKLFERIILKRITPVLKERGIPHYTQNSLPIWYIMR